jgi:hypothetical protein
MGKIFHTTYGAVFSYSCFLGGILGSYINLFKNNKKGKIDIIKNQEA